MFKETVPDCPDCGIMMQDRDCGGDDWHYQCPLCGFWNTSVEAYERLGG